MQKDMLFMTVIEALSRDECAICRLSLNGVRRYLDNFLYERVNDPWTRDTLVQSRGYCPVHAWQLINFIDSGTGIAIVYRHLLEEFSWAFAHEMSKMPVNNDTSRWRPWAATPSEEAAREVRRWMEPRTPCPVCADQWDAEDRYVATTATALSDLDFRARYEASLGLCLRHMTTVLERTRATEDFEWIVRTEQRLIEHLVFELAEFWRKHDWNNRHEAIGEERTSWKRVLHKMAGAPGMVWRQRSRHPIKE